MLRVARVSLAVAVVLAFFNAFAGAQSKGTAAPKTSTASLGSRDVCTLMTTAELSELVGLRVERAEKAGETCQWFANAADQQKRAQDDIRGTFEKLTKQEPASAEEGPHTMEGILRGIGGLASSSGAFLTASVQWTALMKPRRR